LADRSVDLLVSNPPYLSAAEYQDLDPAVRDYEPELALRSGIDGLDATREILRDGLRVTIPGGTVILELAAVRATESAAIAVALGWDEVRVDDDIFGRPRYLVARRGTGS
jgi:release factor glutamine methyltransferase